MFRPIALCIGLRYTRAKRRNHFISFISLMSMLGIALGILVLITVMSVMNGFDEHIKARIFSLVPHMTVSGREGSLSQWKDMNKKIAHFKFVSATSPFVGAQVLLNARGVTQPALIEGILPNREIKTSAVVQKMVEGSLAYLKPDTFNIVLGQVLADRLGVLVGDKVTVLTSAVSMTPAGVTPRFKRFTVAGIFSVGGGFGFDGGVAFIPLKDAQTLFMLGDHISGLHVKITDAFLAPALTDAWSHYFSDTIRISNWTDQFGPFFHVLQLEKTMMFFILFLIIAVAIFNLISTLVMVVNDKSADIAILRTLGATPGKVMMIFMAQGVMIGLIGTLLGVIVGLLLASHVTVIVEIIQHLFHVQFLSSTFYFIDYLPSKIMMSDVIIISGAALLMSLIATIYPAWKASRIQPAEALRYE